MELKSNSIVVILVDAAWASGVNVEAWLGPAKDTSPPNAKAFAVQIRDTAHQFGLLVQAIYGDQPKATRPAFSYLGAHWTPSSGVRTWRKCPAQLGSVNNKLKKESLPPRLG